MALSEILERLESYRHDERGWDSDGAAPFAPAHVDHAVRVAGLLADVAGLMQCSAHSGGIQLELRHQGRFAAFDIVGDGRVYALSGTEAPLVFHQGDDAEDIPCDDASLALLARWVSSGGCER